MAVAPQAVCIRGVVGMMYGMCLLRHIVARVIRQMDGKTAQRIHGSPGITLPVRVTTCTSTMVAVQLANGMRTRAGGFFILQRMIRINNISSTGCKFAKITDGLSNTIALSEVRHHLETSGDPTAAGAKDSIFQYEAVGIAGIRNNPSVCLTYNSGGYLPAGTSRKGKRGNCWRDGQIGRSGFNTVLPPNSPSCSQQNNQNADATTVVYPPTSGHPSGVVVVMADGATKFINDTIDYNGGSSQAPRRDATRCKSIWCLGSNGDQGRWGSHCPSRN